MGLLEQLQTDDFRNKYAGITTNSSKWQVFYGKENIDRKLNVMLDTIQGIIGDAKIDQILVHRHDCPACQASIPKFGMLKQALHDRIANYSGMEVELNENLRFNGEKLPTTGKTIYKSLQKQTKGVPFIIQNAEVSDDGQVIPREDWFVSFIGKLTPFRFLATTFNIENQWMDET